MTNKPNQKGKGREAPKESVKKLTLEKVRHYYKFPDFRDEAEKNVQLSLLCDAMRKDRVFTLMSDYHDRCTFINADENHPRIPDLRERGFATEQVYLGNITGDERYIVSDDDTLNKFLENYEFRIEEPSLTGRNSLDSAKL